MRDVWRRQGAKQDQRIERRLAACEGVGDPQAVKTQRLDLAGDGGDVLHDVRAGLGGAMGW